MVVSMKKKIILINILLILMLFTGCGKIETMKLPVLHFYTFGKEQPDIQTVEDEINRRFSEKIGAEINIHIIGENSYSEIVKSLIESGEPCDIMFVGYNNPYTTMIERGYLYPLNDLIKKNAPLLRESVSEYLMKSAVFNGEIYAVPNEQINATKYSVYVKKDLSDEYNFEKNRIKSISDLEKFYEWVKVYHPELYPCQKLRIEFFYPKNGDMPNGNFFGGLRTIADGEGRVRVVHESELQSYLDLANLSVKWFDKGYIREDIDSITDDTYSYTEGKYASIVLQDKPNRVGEFKVMYGYEIVPVYSTEYYMNNHTLSTTMLGISSKSKYPEKAIKLIEMLNTDKELYNLICFGIEGNHYTLNSEQKVVIKENGGYMPMQHWSFGNQFNAMIMEGQDNDVWEETKKINSTAPKSPFIGFYCEDLRKEYIEKIVQLESVTDMWYGYACCGSMAVSEWYPQYMDELKQAGIKEVMEALQNSVDEYMRENIKNN